MGLRALAAGNPECDPTTGTGCTSGRADEELAELESPASNETERIDFVFVIPPADPAACAARVVPLPICWPSDHVGVQVALACD